MKIWIMAFIIGGLLCVFAQILVDKTKLTPARILVTYVVSGVVLTALGLYQPLIDLAGCGASVSLTGFGYSLAKGVEKAVDEQGLVGALVGGLTATAAGITTALMCAVGAALFAKSKPK